MNDKDLPVGLDASGPWDDQNAHPTLAPSPNMVREEQAAFTCRPVGPRPIDVILACGEAATEGLAALIGEAVLAAEEDRVTALDSVLRQVETLLTAARADARSDSVDRRAPAGVNTPYP